MIRYFLFIFLHILGFAHAEIEERFLKNILNDGNWIQFNDDSVWEVIENQEEVRFWQDGDVLYLEIKTFVFGDQMISIKNARTENSAQIYPTCLQIPNQEWIRSIICIDESKETVLLDDGSVWKLEIGFVRKFKMDKKDYWKVGERVAAIPVSKNRLCLINFDRQHWNSFYADSFNPIQNMPHYHISEMIWDESLQEYFICLNNEIRWKILDLSDSSQDSNSIKQWKKEDEVILDCHVYIEYTDNEDTTGYEVVDFYLINLTNLGKIKVDLCPQRRDIHLPRIKKIEQLYSCRIFWNKTLLTLDDGSQWSLEYRMSNWKTGDSILMTGKFGSESNQINLINLNVKQRGNGFFADNSNSCAQVYAEKIHSNQ